jgi:hypothetical protein
MIPLAYALVHILKIVKLGTYVFPVRGHQYLPCDGDFRQNKIHRRDVVDVLREWDDIVGSVKHDPSPFKVVKYAWSKIMFSMKSGSV